MRKIRYPEKYFVFREDKEKVKVLRFVLLKGDFVYASDDATDTGYLLPISYFRLRGFWRWQYWEVNYDSKKHVKAKNVIPIEKYQGI